MTSGERGVHALEIVQTHDVGARDKRDLAHHWGKVVWREGVGPLYTTAYYLWYGFAAFLIVSILVASRELNDVAPSLALQLLAAGLGFGLSQIAVQWLGWR